MSLHAILRVWVLLLCSHMVLAQLATPVPPKSFAFEIESRKAVQSTALAPLNLEKIYREDDQTLNSNRFAAFVPHRFDLKKVATQDKVEGGTVYRYSVTLPKALGLFVIYERFYLPKGATLHMYKPDQSLVRGAYTHRNNKKTGTFMTGEIKGNSFTLEYFEPDNAYGEIIVEGFYARYIKQEKEGLPGVKRGSGVDNFGESAICNVDINCEQSDIFQTAKKSSVRIYMAIANGLARCSGTIMNNTRQDKDPLVLSAFHCVDGLEPRYDLWRFDFDYELADCAESTLEPSFRSLIGAELLAGYRESDFILVRIAEDIPTSYNVRYAGWDARDTPTIDSAFIIHHPQGDVKKISVYNGAPIIYNRGITWNNGVRTPPFHHFNGFFKKGTFQPGSSGAALYNQQGQVIGQLHGGNGSCNLPKEIETFSGRLAVSYDGRTTEQQLKNFLDPDNTGLLVLGAIDPQEQVYALSGTISSGSGTFIDSVLVKRYEIEGKDTTIIDSIYSSNDGTFAFELNSSKRYWFTFEKEAEAAEYLSFSDLSKLQQLLLVREPTTNRTHLAGDINKDTFLSVVDLNMLQTILLGRSIQFPFTWLFYDPNTFTSEAPFFNASIRGFEIQPIQDIELNLLAIKSGDLNFSAK